MSVSAGRPEGSSGSYVNKQTFPIAPSWVYGVANG